MQAIASVQFVQIQRSPMKTGEGSQRVYRPAPLEQVQRLYISAEGITGFCADGQERMDVHHTRHPQSRFRGDNKISLGFLHHYDTIRERFGEHMVDGVAGENILLKAHGELPEFSPEQRFYIRHMPDGTLIELQQVIPAPPCREFSTFCLRKSPSAQELKATLQFLDHGRRGYYADIVETDCRCTVQAGDVLLID